MAQTAPTPITALPTPPSRSGPDNFAARGDAFLGALPTFGTQTNSTATNVYNNAVDAYNNALAAASYSSIAQTLTNFKGLWSNLSGPLNMPATVLYANAYWLLTQNTLNVSAEVPGVSAIWTPLILDARPLANGYDLNTLVATGKYSIVSPVNGPSMTGASFSAVVEVTKFGTDAIQEFIATTTRRVWRRRIFGIGGTTTFGSWYLMSEDNPAFIPATGAVVDCSLGVYFYTTISSNTTISITNQPANSSYAFVLEIHHTGGTITLPANAVWVNTAAPTLVLNRRHLFYFQAVATGSGGWIVSALPNSAA